VCYESGTSNCILLLLALGLVLELVPGPALVPDSEPGLELVLELGQRSLPQTVSLSLLPEQ